MSETSDRITKLDKLVYMLSECEKHARSMDPRDARYVMGALEKAKARVNDARGKVVGRVKADIG